mgnify:CR=1 FL=1
MIAQDSPAIGRFDKSFLVHMIRDFFVLLLIVTVVEFAIKAALVYYDHRANGAEQARRVAQDIAEDVRRIMRNEGGPVAARTVYPILERNWSDLGYAIAVAPSDVTVKSIEAAFGFTPKGIPAENWPAGRYQGAEVAINAQSACLACHSEAQVGDELGRVTVRSYLRQDFVKWVQDVKLSGGLALGKIVLHSVLLFVILCARLGPLMRLRAVVGGLARANGGLDHRAEIRTADEFGALARDLNRFLDRIGQVIADLDTILGRVVKVNDDIVTIQGQLRDRIDTLVCRIRRLERDAMLAAKAEPRLSQHWFDAARHAVDALRTTHSKAQSGLQTDDAVGDTPAEDTRPQPDDIAWLLDELRAVIGNAEAQIAGNEALFARLAELGDDSEQLRRAMAEMSRLEERMQNIIESGSALVHRVRPAESDDT